MLCKVSSKNKHKLKYLVGSILNWGEKEIDSKKLHPIVQMFHIAGCHWAVVSNLDVREKGCHRDAVDYYDLMRTLSIGLSTRKVVCSLY